MNIFSRALNGFKGSVRRFFGFYTSEENVEMLRKRFEKANLFSIPDSNEIIEALDAFHERVEKEKGNKIGRSLSELKKIDEMANPKREEKKEAHISEEELISSVQEIIDDASGRIASEIVKYYGSDFEEVRGLVKETEVDLDVVKAPVGTAPVSTYNPGNMDALLDQMEEKNLAESIDSILKNVEGRFVNSLEVKLGAPIVSEEVKAVPEPKTVKRLIPDPEKVRE